MAESILNLLEFAFRLWNGMTKFALELLVQAPEEFSGGKPWELIKNLEPVFVAIGGSLTAVFFLAGWANESLSFKDDMRVENILRMFLRLSITEALVTYSMQIIQVLFRSVGVLVSYIGMDGSYELGVTEEQKEIIKQVGFFDGFLAFLVFVVLFLLVLACGFFLVYAVFFRFLRTLVMVPYGAVAMSTYAGSGRITDVMVSYLKSLASVLLEGVSIVLSIEISNLFMMYGMTSDVMQIASDLPAFLQVIIQLILDGCTILLTVGAVKSAKDWTGRMFGL